MNRLHAVCTLATAAALLTLSAGARADSDTSDAPPVAISVRSDSPDVTVGYVTERAAAMASNGASAMGVAWKDVCVAPCEFKLPAGLHELVITGPGYVGATSRVDLRPGSDNRYVVKPGSSLMRLGGWTLATLGLTALITGATFAAVGVPKTDSKGNMTTSTPGWAVPLAIGGGLATIGGLTMVFTSSTSIQRETGGTAARGVFVGAGYTGRF